MSVKELQYSDIMKNLSALSCKNCAHSDTCVLIRAVGQICESHFSEEKKPFSEYDIAKICRYYLSREVIKNFTE